MLKKVSLRNWHQSQCTGIGAGIKFFLRIPSPNGEQYSSPPTLFNFLLQPEVTLSSGATLGIELKK